MLSEILSPNSISMGKILEKNLIFSIKKCEIHSLVDKNRIFGHIYPYGIDVKYKKINFYRSKHGFRIF